MFTLMDECIWQELNDGANINSFRRELQRIHTYRLIELLLNERDTIPHDAAALARYYLKNTRNKIEAIDQSNLDRMTVIHLMDIADQIESALEVEYRL